MKLYEEAQETLIKMRSELEQRLKRIERQIRQPLDPDLDDQAVESEREEVLADLSAQIRTELNDITTALARLERNEYEICAKCGQHIAVERLKVLPFTALCFSCAEKSHSLRL